jgi:sugar phosphate isomerase/epimerase
VILGLAAPTYSGAARPKVRPVTWLLERCAEYGLRAIEASLPQPGSPGADRPDDVRRRAADLGIEWIGYWNDDWITPAGGPTAHTDRAARAFDVAVAGGCRTVAIFGSGAKHHRFMKVPPLAEQLRLMARHLTPVAEEGQRRGLRLGLLPHLDYRAVEILDVVRRVDHPALRTAFDTANAFPVCEEPLEAARLLAPHTIAVALKDVEIRPHRSNDVTIFGTPIGDGSVDFDAILPVLAAQLPDPASTTACIKLRLPDGSTEHDAWMRRSLEFLRSRLP